MWVYSAFEWNKKAAHFMPILELLVFIENCHKTMQMIYCRGKIMYPINDFI